MVGPAKQLWQPVSARARVAMFRRSLLRVFPVGLEVCSMGGDDDVEGWLGLWAALCPGLGCLVPGLGRVPSVMSLTTSWIALSSASTSVMPWSWRPQKQHAVLLFGGGRGRPFGFGGVALGGGCCFWRLNCTSSSTVWSLSGSFNRSAWMSGSVRLTHSWSATSGCWLSHSPCTSGRIDTPWPGLAGGPRTTRPCLESSWRASLDLAALLFFSCTAIALMRSGSAYSLRGVGPVALMVTSRQSLGSRHASSWMGQSGWLPASTLSTGWGSTATPWGLYWKEAVEEFGSDQI